jgi:hypothetical protein
MFDIIKLACWLLLINSDPCLGLGCEGSRQLFQRIVGSIEKFPQGCPHFQGFLRVIGL